MKIKQTLLTTVISLSAISASFAETPAQALEKGVQLQETEGEFLSAISAFEKVIADGKDTTDAVAEAHYRLAQCYFSLAEDEKAKEQLTKLREAFGKDNTWVRKASKLGTNAIKFLPAPFKKEGEFHYYDIQTPDGKVVGNFMGGIMANHYKGKKVWQSFFGRGFGEKSFSTCVFDAESFRPIDAQIYFKSIGNSIVNYRADGSSSGKNFSVDQDLGVLKVPDGVDCLYDNDQVMQLVRVIDIKPGEKVSMSVRNPILPIVTPIIFHAIEYVDITVPLGTFKCIKVESSILQTFYISNDDNRYLVKLEMPGGAMNLSEVEDWVASQSPTLQAEEISFSYQLPASAMWYSAKDTDDLYKIHFHLGDFSILEGSLEVRTRSNDGKEPQNSRALEDQVTTNYKKSYADYTVDEGSREQVTINDKDAEITIVRYKKGQLAIATYQAHLVTKDHRIRIKCYFQENRKEDARSALLEILKSISFD